MMIAVDKVRIFLAPKVDAKKSKSAKQLTGKINRSSF